MSVANVARTLHHSQFAPAVRRRAVPPSRPREFSTKLFFGGRRPILSLLCSGLVLGVGLTIPIAAFYHFSGIKTAVDTAQATLKEINRGRTNAQKPRGKPTESLTYLRAAAKAYVSSIPFAPHAVDKAFDSVEASIDAHSDEAAVIIENLGKKMAAIVEHHKAVTVPAAWELLSVVREETGKLREVAVKAVDPSVVESAQKVAQTSLKSAWETSQWAGKGAVNFVQGKLAERKERQKDENAKKDDETSSK